MNTQKEARRDTEEFARAQMFYGEGAGTRRKLIQATVDAKVRKDPTYARLFHLELNRQDMAEHAAKARRERQTKDRNETVLRSAKGLATGNYRSVNTGLLILAVGGYYAHKTGLDKKLYDKAQVKFYSWRNKRHAKRVLHDVTNVRRMS